MTDQPKRNITSDSDLIRRAHELVLKTPNLDVIRPDSRGKIAEIATILENAFKVQASQGTLLLPDLSFLKNQSIGIFSDYSGEAHGNYYVYSFVVCAFNLLGPFHQQMRELRERNNLPSKEIAFKDFGMGQLQRLLPEYLNLTNNSVQGLLFTLMVDKRVISLFGGAGRESQKAVAKALADEGLGVYRPRTAEKLMRVAHTAAYLTALLAQGGQKIFLMTDNDEISPNQEKHEQFLKIFQNVLALYTDKQFPLIGGALPFEPRSLDYLDVLSIADVAAGSLNQLMTSRDTDGPDNAMVKPGADKVLQWISRNGYALKKATAQVIHNPKGGWLHGPLTLENKVDGENDLYIPMIVPRR